VTLTNGFFEQSTYDASVAPPVGSGIAGRTISTVSGSLRSDNAGGVVEVRTVVNASVVKYNGEPYPRSGMVQALGRRGTLQLTALSADAVRLDLDVNDDGTAESSDTVTWDWLL
jgi:hypothetical protein